VWKIQLSAVQRYFGPIDVFINNAGVIQVGPMEHMTLQDYEEAMKVHFRGPLYAIPAVVPDMRQRKAGRIVNIASINTQLARAPLQIVYGVELRWVTRPGS